MKNKIITIITTKKIPTPIPALKIPPITEQLVIDVIIINSMSNLSSLFRMIFNFYLFV